MTNQVTKATVNPKSITDIVFKESAMKKLNQIVSAGESSEED